jgi:hypothetical protein
MLAAAALAGPICGCNTPPSILDVVKGTRVHEPISAEIFNDSGNAVVEDSWSASAPEPAGTQGPTLKIETTGPDLHEFTSEAPVHFAAPQNLVQVSSSRKGQSELFASARPETPIRPVKATASVELLNEPREFFVVLADGTKKGEGDETYRMPFHGTETVRDAVEQIGAAQGDLAKKRIWVARSGATKELPVDWAAITQRKDLSTNYRLAAGDRVMIQGNKQVAPDSFWDRIKAPVDAFLEDIKSPFDLIFGGTWPDGTNASPAVVRDKE